MVNNPKSTDAHESLVNGHRDGKLKLSDKHIDTIVNNPKSTYAHESLVNGHRDGKLKLTDKQKQTLRS